MNRKIREILKGKLLVAAVLILSAAAGSICSASERKEGEEVSIITAVDLRSAVAFASDGGHEAVLSDYTGDDATLFLAESAGEGAVYLKNRSTGLYLAPENNSPESGVRAEERAFTGEDAQKWIFESLPDGHFVVASKLGTVLDLAGSGTDEGTAVLLCSRNGGLNQEWDLIRNGEIPSGAELERGTNITGAVPSGRYIITSGLDDHLMLCTEEGPKDGSGLEIADSSAKGIRIFQIAEQEDGTCSILAEDADGLSLDVLDASAEPGAVLQLRSYDGTIGQRWEIIPAEEFGYYQIRSGLGTVLDVYKERKVSGTKVGMFSPTGGRNQIWRLFRIG